jgi:ABC-type sugar transport system substrate-binding protein
MKESRPKISNRRFLHPAGTLGFTCVVLLLVLGAFGLSASAGIKHGVANRTVVVFGINPQGDGYLTKLFAGFKAEAPKRHLTLKYVLNPQDQTVMNNQIQQYLATGSKPDAFIWMPTTQAAGLGQLRRLAKTGVPVFLSNRPPEKIVLPYIKFYTGTDFAQNGRVSATAIISARNKLKAQGKLHSARGNLVIVSWPQAYNISAFKFSGVTAGLKKSPMDVVDHEYAPSPDQNGGFAAMNTAISKVGSKKVDIVYAYNDGMLDGAIQALKAAGYSPGKDVLAVGGNCWGNFTPLEDGSQYSTMVVGGVLEGRYMMATVAQDLAKPKVHPGTFIAPGTRDKFPKLPATPFKNNLLPQPALVVAKGSTAANKKKIDTSKLWGVTAQKLCT